LCDGKVNNVLIAKATQCVTLAIDDGIKLHNYNP